MSVKKKLKFYSEVNKHTKKIQTLFLLNWVDGIFILSVRFDIFTGIPKDLLRLLI